MKDLILKRESLLVKIYRLNKEKERRAKADNDCFYDKNHLFTLLKENNLSNELDSVNTDIDVFKKLGFSESDVIPEKLRIRYYELLSDLRNKILEIESDEEQSFQDYEHEQIDNDYTEYEDYDNSFFEFLKESAYEEFIENLEMELSI